jgi:acyl-[acyl-carrier-protein] desaturase
VRVWTSEEDQHSTLLETYLLLTDNGDHAERGTRRKAVLASGWTHQLDSPFEAMVYTSVQELATRAFYVHTARVCENEDPALASALRRIAKDETRHEMFYEQKLQDCLAEDPETMPMVIEALKEFGMPGAQLLDDYDRRRAAMEQAAFPTLADKKGAFVRLFGKMERIVGRDNAMRVLTEGNYLSDGQDDPSRKKMRPEMITRLLTRKLV